MKFFNYILLIALFATSYQCAKASSTNTVSGIGCNLGNRIYTQKIGTSNFYGASYDVYNANGTNYAIDWNNKSTCDNINASDIYDKKTACWVSSCVNPTNNNSGVSYGTLVNYSLETCSANPPVGLPLDDYNLFIIFAVSALGIYFITKKRLIPSQL